MSFFEAIASGFRKYAEFSGRATRPEFWWFILFYCPRRWNSLVAEYCLRRWHTVPRLGFGNCMVVGHVAADAGRVGTSLARHRQNLATRLLAFSTNWRFSGASNFLVRTRHARRTKSNGRVRSIGRSRLAPQHLVAQVRNQRVSVNQNRLKLNSS